MTSAAADVPSRPGVRGWLDRHDPTRYAAHRGIRAAIAVTVALPLSRVLVGDPQFTLFAAFGSLSLIIFVDFPGNRQVRAFSYVVLGLAGMVLIALGTLASTRSWLAVLGMALVGFAVLFAGVLSAATAAAGRALLLAFVLPVTIPVPVDDLWLRVGGWGLGMVISIPLALFVWPPREDSELRTGVSRACRSLAAFLAGVGNPEADLAAADTAMKDLQHKFRASVSRPIGLSAGERLLARVVRDLDWLSIEARGASALGSRPEHETPWSVAPAVTTASAAVLTASGEALDQPSTTTREHVTARLLDLTGARAAALEGWVGDALAGRTATDLPAAERVHSLAYATDLVGRHVSAALAADARRPLDKILGRGSELVVSVSLAGSTRLARQHLSLRSVWLQNSLRGGLGMALAVLLAQVTEVSHGFWVALGAMSVLRSSALNTGATAFRALLGTVVGVVLGTGVLVLIGNSPVAWVLLPIAIFLAGSASDAISFSAGQAAFSLAVLIMFSLLSPVGWEVGLVRLEDVAIGVGAALVVGLLLWPRGAGGAIRRAMADAFGWNARLLGNAVARLTGERTLASTDRDEVIGAAFRLDDALRQYLADRGTKAANIDDLIAACVGCERVRLTTEALADLADRSAGSARDRFGPELANGFRARSGDQTRWLESAAQTLSGTAAGVPDAPPADAVAGLLSAAQREPAEREALEGSSTGLWIGIHLDDLARHERRVGPHVAALSARRSKAQASVATGSG